MFTFFFFFSSRRRHTRLQGDWSSDVCSSDLAPPASIEAPPWRWSCRRARWRGPERAKEMSSSSKRSEEHTSELQSPCNLVCRLLLEKKKKKNKTRTLTNQGR